jgi:hypothetical protein
MQGGNVINARSGTPKIVDDLNKRIHADPSVWCSLLPIADGLMIVVKK